MSRKGFTLVELVIVLVILAILVGIALPSFMGARKRAYRAEALQILDEMKTMAWSYNLEKNSIPGNTTDWPNTLGALGYTGDYPNTTNWQFDVTKDQITGAPASLTCSGSPAEAVCVKLRAIAKTTGSAATLPNVTLWLDWNGTAGVKDE